MPDRLFSAQIAAVAEELHRRREAIAGPALRLLPITGAGSGPAFAWLLHMKYAHTFLGHGAREASESLNSIHGVIGSQPGPTLFFKSGQCARVEDARFDSVIYLVASESRNEPSSELATAVELLASFPELRCIQRLGANICIDLGPSADGFTRSYSVTDLPGTIFLEHHPSPFVNAENIIHEAAHCFLNECLAASGEKVDSVSPRWWSPWKNELRPTFGFLHACFAFSVVTIYQRLLSGREDAATVAYATLQGSNHAQLLARSQPAFLDALRELKSTGAVRLLRLAFNEAVNHS